MKGWPCLGRRVLGWAEARPRTKPCGPRPKADNIYPREAPVTFGIRADPSWSTQAKRTEANRLTVADSLSSSYVFPAKLFMNAWEAVCKTAQETTLIVPARKTFLLNPVKFLGPCKSPSIQILVLGNIVAPSKMSDWTTPYMGSWIVFARVNGVKVIGNGQIDGRGFECGNVHPARFLSVSYCDNVTISNLHITNPETSPNTDGMDLTHSTKIHVRNCHLSTGDDCIANLLVALMYSFVECLAVKVMVSVLEAWDTMDIMI
ncbi:hypothetical protein GH714_037855 [Hevea brasiliensis]|uniref:Uncharacterized protein n=1 Tax=Hevea brasiliensis TaxID=3981 RepID=A0A6A6LQQ1_HEVBR|nr:hypothetical protein GH714_037855 [Hevea brasiliensis]